jgi:hypothetical protein
VCGNDEFRVDWGYFKKIRCKKAGVTCAPWSDINEEKEVKTFQLVFRPVSVFFANQYMNTPFSNKRHIF